MMRITQADGAIVVVQGRVEEMIAYLLEVRDLVEGAPAGSVTLFFKDTVVRPEYRQLAPQRRVRGRAAR